MPFKWFQERGGRSKFAFAVVTLQRSYALTLNEQAYEELGKPQQVMLAFDDQDNRIAIRAAQQNESGAYELRDIGGSTYLASARAFFNYFGITLEETWRYRAELAENMLIINLNTPIATVRRRKKETAGR